ncbi:MAG: hypothetical protein ACFFCQ_13385 [Promethearchaeota archaeon]
MSADEITEEEELPDLEVSAKEDEISQEIPVSEHEEESTPSSTPLSLTRDGVVGSLDELFDVAPEEPKSDTAGMLERRFEELMTTDSPVTALKQADTFEEMKTDIIVGELEALADEKESRISEDEAVEIPDTFSEIYKELDSPSDDKDSLFDWDPMKLFSDDTDAYTFKEMAIKRSLIKSQTPFIIEKGQTQIVGINKKRAKALRKHFGVKSLEDLLSLDSKVVAKKLGRKVKPEMVDDWKTQVHLFL